MSVTAAAVLENEGISSDPLEIVAELGGNALSEWHVVAGHAGLTVLVLRSELGGLIFCYDRGGERDCVRMRTDGVEMVRVVGRRPSFIPFPNSTAAQSGNRIDSFIDTLLDSVERKLRLEEN